jgi:hypothetical protein
MKIGATHVTGESKDLGPETYGVRYAGSWTEAWQVEACGGTKFEVPIQFTADGDGGAYINVRANNVRVVR